METTKEVGRWLGCGLSEKIEIMREELMFGSMPSVARSLPSSFG
jgi:hypothetical protein